MKIESNFAFIVLMSLLLGACSKDDSEIQAPTSETDEVYFVLNAGDWKSNNSSLTLYDASTGKTIQNYFELQNGRCLGNTANDVIVYGGKMYIAVAGEGTIEVTDLNARSIRQVECGAEPRSLVAHDGRVYATYFDGYVARLDTFSLVVDATVKVGRNPERMDVCDGKLFVANSGGMDYNTEIGYDNTVSVVDLASFSEVDRLEVVANPVNVVSDGKGVFVVSYGNYADIPSTLQYFSSGGVSCLLPDAICGMTEICYNSGVLYGFCSEYDQNWNATITYKSYDKESGLIQVPWINDNVLPLSSYKICSVGNYICVTSSDYLNDGDVYLYDTDGVLVDKVPAGLNPVKVVCRE